MPSREPISSSVIGSWPSSPKYRRRILASRSLRSEEHTSELQSRLHLVCPLLNDAAPAAIYLIPLRDVPPILEEEAVDCAGARVEARSRLRVCFGVALVVPVKAGQGKILRLYFGLEGQEPEIQAEDLGLALF